MIIKINSVIKLKIAKVELDAFRAYKEKTEFDFRKDDIVANLIVIYGMNGYGKTSFFDAIEWALTGNINRIKKTQTKRERGYIRHKLKKRERQYVLKNEESPKIQAEINILFDNKQNFRIKTERTRITGTDYKEHEVDETFRLNKDHILTQDAVDNFLRADTSAKRYKLFSEFLLAPKNNINYDIWYQILTKIVELSENELNSCEEKIKNLEYDIANIKLSEDLLTKINKKITSLNNDSLIYEDIYKELQLDSISISFSEDELEGFLLDLRSKQNFLFYNEISLLVLEKNKLSDVINLKEEYSTYRKNIKNKIGLNEKITKNRDILSLIRYKSQILGTIFKSFKTEKDVNIFLSRYRSFIKLRDDIVEILQTKIKLWKLIKKAIISFLKIDRPENYKDYEIFWLDQSIFKEYLQKIAKIKELRAQISVLEEKLTEYESIEEETIYIKQRGIKLIKKAKLDLCPVCGQSHSKEFKSILQQAKTSQISKKLMNKSYLKINELKNELDNDKFDLTSFKLEFHNKADKKAEKISEFVENNEHFIEIINTLSYYDYDTFSFKEEDETFKEMTDDSLRREKFLEFEERHRLKINIDIWSESRFDIRKINSKLSNKIYELKKMDVINHFEKVEDIFEEKGYNLSTLTKRDDLNEKEIIDIMGKLKRIYKREIHQITNLKPEDIKYEMNNDRDKKNYFKSQIEEYEKKAYKILRTAPKSFEMIESIENKTKKKIKFFENLNLRYNQIGTLLKEFQKHIQLEKKKLAMEKLNRDLKKVKKISKKLEKARSILQFYIELSINNYFNKELINELYQKLDPHPIYKLLDFDVTLTKSGPSHLDIFVRSSDKGKLPTLYFSTAQINILSLCIFLARALQVQENKTPHTIFLDDPIQNLDTINILSFIDLLRILISEKFNKQIVISTQDENIYRLIQRKISSDYYPSKFFRLSGLGKVEVD